MEIGALSFSLFVSILVFALIALREWLPSFLKVWHVMTSGALVLLLSGTITPKAAFDAVDWNVMLYLFSVFSIGRALYENGFANQIAHWMTSWRTPGVSLTAFMVVFALVAAVLTNDAAAVIGTPIALMLAHQTGADQKTFLIALCVSVTIGSMVTPVGNPQNLLIAASGEVPAPVITFALWLAVPALISLCCSALWLSKRMKVHEAKRKPGKPKRADTGTRWPALLAIATLLVLVTTESILSVVGSEFGYPLGAAAALACLPVYLFDASRTKTLVKLDWSTLVFFVSMFVVTGALLESGSLEAVLGGARSHMNEPLVTAGISFIGSQIFSNVPLVDMYLKLLPSSDVPNLMMLAAVSTLAGNVFIISAASNVIVLQMSERLGATEVTFTQFMKAVLPIGVGSIVLTILWVRFAAEYLFGAVQ